MMAPKIRILLVDDHEPTRKEIAKFLNRIVEIEIAGEAGNGEEGVRLAAELHPDIIIMDIIMPVMTGIEATAKILSKDNTAKILSLSNYTASNLVAEIQKAGAMGYIRKAEAYEELPPAIIALESGHTYFPDAHD